MSRPRPTSAPARRRLDSPALVALVLALAAVLAYLPALRGEFLEWDDDIYVVHNPPVHGLSWATVRWAFTTVHTGNWIPLTWLSHALDGQLFGLDPLGHHATALLLHAANTVLVFVALRALTGATWRSAVVAALFGLHPLHVESVAWVSERKDVLSTFWWLLAIIFYCAYVAAPGLGRYAWVALAFAAGLLSKPMVVTLPVVLLLLDDWPLRRWSRRAVVEKLPLAAMAAASMLAAFLAQRAEGGTRGITVIPPPVRIANALVSYVRYLRLTIWPATLSPWYSHPALDGPPLSPALVAGSALVLAVITLVVVATRRPHLRVGWAWYVVTLLPVIGLVQVGGQGMADRYTYIPLLGIFVAVVWEVAEWPLWHAPAARRVGATAVVALLVACGVLSWRQSRIWHDSRTFWTTTLARNPRAAIAYYSLASLDARAQRVDVAIREYRRALKIRPDYVNARRQLAGLLVGRERYAAAAAQLRKVIAAGGGAEDRNNLGNVLRDQGRTQAARRQLERALALRPDFVEAHNNLGIVLADDGKLHEAEAEFRAALRIRPDFAPARQNLRAVIDEAVPGAP